MQPPFRGGDDADDKLIVVPKQWHADNYFDLHCYSEARTHSGRTKMPSLQETFARLTTLELFESGEPASPEDIQRIEAELHVGLPEQYLEFLKQFGYIGSFGWEVFGTRPIDPSTGQPSTVTSDCIKATKQEKDPKNPLGISSLPPAHVVISQDGGGGNIVLFGIGAPHEGEVHYYNIEDQPKPIQVWKTLQEYLEHRIEEAIGA